MSRARDIADGKFANDLTVDTNTLVVDAANNRVGIGTASPTTTLQVGDGSADTRSTLNPSTVFAIGVKNGANHGGFIGSNGSSGMQFSSSGGAARMTIDSSGNIGVNTSTPASLLEIKASALNRANGIALRGSGANDILYMYPSADNVATIEHLINGSTSTGGNIVINPQGGHVGIGTASPTQALHVDEPTSNNQAAIIHSSLSTFAGQVLKVTSARATTNSSYNLCLMGADKFAVRDSGNVVNANNSYGQLSDQRLKENITDASSQWADIKALRVRKFNFIDDDLTQIGVVAQEIETAGMSGLVEEAKLSEPDADGNDVVRKNVKYSVLYMKAVKALQEAMTRIETLETKVAASENAS